MGRFDNRYSLIVAWLKILLPLASLAILSSIFLLSRQIDPSQTIPFVELAVEDLAREERLGAPNYAGVTDDGASLFFTARAARPLPGSAGTRFDADGVHATLQRADGSATAVVSDRGLIDTDRQVARLTGGAAVTTSGGIRLNSDTLIARMDRTDIRSEGPVDGWLFDARLEGGLMEITANAQGSVQALFTKGVKLVYLPRQ